MTTQYEVTIGIYLTGDANRLRTTLAGLARHAVQVSIILLPDAPEPEMTGTLTALDHLPQLGCVEPGGEAAAFNRLIGYDSAPIVLFIEAGVAITAGCIERLCAALAQPGVGLAGPSTNFAWNEQRLRDAPGFGATATGIEAYAIRVAERYGNQVATLEPLYSLGDFCYAVRRDVIEAIGAADERYGAGPCWEMDYNIRAARAGFAGVWAQGAYVHRPPHTARRARDERLWFSASKRRYQDNFCRLRIRGEKGAYEAHCRGDECREFAPLDLIRLKLPLLPAVPQREGEPAPNAVSNMASAAVAPVPGIEAHAAVAEPLASCIMPTCNRRQFIPRAIRCFLQQDYHNRELIIVDDGEQPVADCVPDDQRIRYIRLEGKRTVGAKRNLACAEARGEIILHWDDDDWYPSWRVRAQVRALLDRSAELCGSSEVFFYDAAAGRAWRYAYSGGGPWVAGNTLAYRRSAWARIPFANMQVGEDTRFVRSHATRGICDLAEPAICVAAVHPGNVSPKSTRGAYWHPVPTETIHAALGTELRAYFAVLQPGASTDMSPIACDPGLPLVSCIMPTRNRRSFVALALQHFQQQDYPNKELVIVDDGTDAVGDIAEGLPGVRYVRLLGHGTIGGKRNLACRQAQGELLAHWDDDDWYGSGRLSAQVGPILAGEADLTGLVCAFVLELPAGRFWSVRPELHRRMFVGDVHGGTLMYRRALLQQGIRYPEVNLAEDAAFILQAIRSGRRLLRLANPGLFVYVRHGQNAWRLDPGRFLDPSGWESSHPPVDFTTGTLASYRAAAAPAGQLLIAGG